MDRAHRIGQKKEVQVFRFCVDASIEEKVIEKAYKKLRLDAMVIQQGRLTDNTKTVNKDDLLSMVRYGAEKVFSGGVSLLFCWLCSHVSRANTSSHISQQEASHACWIYPCLCPKLLQPWTALQVTIASR